MYMVLSEILVLSETLERRIKTVVYVFCTLTCKIQKQDSVCCNVEGWLVKFHVCLFEIIFCFFYLNRDNHNERSKACCKD